jgi:L-iditol 2-dehydrogenase
MMARGELDPGFMVTHRFPFNETKRAFDLVTAYADGVMKAIVTFP